ncbi:MAG TPA: hypothetical protein VFV72_17080 [Candidatus Limnocylindrales bacterium]|nr:hypothetical protein [Candidatus Limnocylindrales bacterium]
MGTATAGFLASDSARFELTATRHRPNLPAEVTAIGSGIVDPAGDRGRMRYELFPNDADDSAFAEKPLEIAWTATDYWVRAAQDDSDRAWQHTTRARAPEQMNLIGRVNEEPVALLRMAAAATPADVRAGASAELDGRPAERWLVSVPAEVASDNFVPPDTYLGFSQIFGRSDLPLEVWLVAGTVVRIGYVLEREKAPYGGPDRLETWYDWSGIGGPIELEVPPPGEIEDVGAG